MSRSLNGISCNVESCRYNREQKYCVADKINVGCTCECPDCCDETQCRTFEAKD